MEILLKSTREKEAKESSKYFQAHPTIFCDECGTVVTYKRDDNRDWYLQHIETPLIPCSKNGKKYKIPELKLEEMG